MFGVLHDVPLSYALFAPRYWPDLKLVCAMGSVMQRLGHEPRPRACFPERKLSMSRIPAREAIIASSAVSAVVSMCLLGAVVASSSAAAKAPSATSIAGSPRLQPSTTSVGNRALVSGSHRGVWFGLAATAQQSVDKLMQSEASTAATAPTAAASTPAPAPATTTAPAPAPATHSAVRQQSRSSVLAAVSGSPRDMARTLAATHGWTGSQWVCLDKLWQHESNYETTVRNPSSGAYGIPQALPASKMSTAGPDWRNNPVTQIQWGLSYIGGRYGSPCGAWSYWVRHLSY